MLRRLSFLLLLFAATARADGPQDNIVDKVRPVPPLGIVVPAEVRDDLTAGLDSLGKEIDSLRFALKAKPALLELLPDVEVLYRAVSIALKYNEFYSPKEFPGAKKLLALGAERAKNLRDGQAPWLEKPGVVVRGYVSKIDGSIQPYGLVVPASFKQGSGTPQRLDVWFHGRGETLTELSFLLGSFVASGIVTPPNTLVLHPYGRYCNANHFAGEIDTFEAIDHLKKNYPVDRDRIVMRGFSMGGAACWNFAVHYSGLWAAAAPGAGFSESPDFLKVFQKETLQPTWYEKKLFHLYDCTDWAVNLTQCPTVAYSGEKDSQKQAADIMARALKAEGMDLVHIIGANAGHQYTPAGKAEVSRRIDAIADLGKPVMPRSIRFITYTLRYPKMRWINVERMTRHWTPARVDADIVGEHEIRVKTTGVEAFSIKMHPGTSPLTGEAAIVINGTAVKAGPLPSDRSLDVTFVKADQGWIKGPVAKGFAKRPLMQGPIDDAFMDSFIMVRPTGKPLSDKVGLWTSREMAHAVDHWRKQFRGDAPILDDTAIRQTDIKSSNLVLWGDPSSNAILKQIAPELPISWTADGIRLGKDGKTFAPGNHAVAMIYPNPLNPDKYVVLNSGFTFREYDYLNNARQIPKLPDWAVLDVDQPRTSRRPAGIADAAFFGERWELTNNRE
jgi:predicted esterase